MDLFKVKINKNSALQCFGLFWLILDGTKLLYIEGWVYKTKVIQWSYENQSYTVIIWKPGIQMVETCQVLKGSNF
jgi:hypothetical protein